MDFSTKFQSHIQILMERYTAVLNNSPYDYLVIHAGTLQGIFLDDYHYPFQVNPHFKLWLPLAQDPNSILIIQPGNRPRLLHHRPIDFWHKTPEEPEGFWVDQFDITPFNQVKEVKTLLPQNQSFAFIGGAETLAKEWGAKAINPNKLLNPLHYQRAYKTEYEKSCIREANRIATRGHQAAQKAFFDGASEFKIQQAYLAITQHREQELPYGNIIALNQNAAILHYQYYDLHSFTQENRHSFLIDAGANFQGYAADITRTYSGKDDEFAELIESMDQKQRQIIDEIQIGSSYLDLHLRMHHLISQILQEFQFVNLEAEVIVEKQISVPFYPHGLGHFLGLQVHDMGGWMKNQEGEIQAPPEEHSALRLTRQVEIDQIFTIEPGLYFIPSLLQKLKEGPHAQYINWKRVDQFMKYGGIRIEDNVCVEAERVDNYTRQSFQEMEA